MRILWSSNAPWSCSGYGVQSKHIVPRFRALGHEVANFAWDGLHWGRLTVDGIDVLPGGYLPFGVDLIGEHARAFRADLVISLQDIWVLPVNYPELVGVPWACWFPVDHTPLSWKIDRVARVARYPIVYSRFGQREMEQAGIPCRYIPHGVETRTFYPRSKADARAAMGLPEAGFLAAMVAANKGYPSRKALSENMQAFALFAEAHPELDARLYIHTEATRSEDGLDLHRIARALGIADRTLFPDRYQYIVGLPEEAVASVYNAADVLLAASCAEGFGLPIIEAQACGCPVITTDFSSMSELTVNGVATPPAQLTWTALDAWHATPGVVEIVRAMNVIAGWDEETRRERSARGIQFARREYEWDVVVERYWKPFLEQVELDIREVANGCIGSD